MTKRTTWGRRVVSWTLSVLVAATANIGAPFGSGAPSAAAAEDPEPDRLNWESKDNVSPFLNGVAYGDGKFMMVNSDRQVFTSTNGTTWTSIGAAHVDPGSPINFIKYVNGQFIIGTSRSISSTPGLVNLVYFNGTNWTTLNSGMNNYSFDDIAWGSGKYVIPAGNGNSIVYGTTNGTFQAVTLPWTKELYAVEYIGTRFVAVGSAGALATSTDGIAWTTSNLGGATLNDLVSNGTVTVAVGEWGTIWYSTEPGGLPTTQAHSPKPGIHLRSVAYGGGRFIAVADDGDIISSKNGIDWKLETNGLTTTIVSGPTTIDFRAAAAAEIGGKPVYVAAGVPNFAVNVPPSVPVLNNTALNAENVTKSSAKLRGAIVKDGGRTVTSYGFKYTSSSSPMPSDWIDVPSSLPNGLAADVTGLESGTTYYYKACAVNFIGEGCSSPKIFKTPMAEPLVTPPTTAEDTMSDAIVIAKQSASTAFYKITNLRYGKVYKSDGTTLIAAGTYITAAEGLAGLKFMPDPNFYTVAVKAGFDVQATLDTSDTQISAAKTVDVAVTGVNDPPIVHDDPLSSMRETDAVRTIAFWQVLGNDSVGAENEWSDQKTVTAVTYGTGGNVAIAGSNIVFTRTEGYSGPASFTYEMSDGTWPGDRAGVVTFEIEQVAAEPTVAGTLSTAEDTMSEPFLITTTETRSADVHFFFSDIKGGKLYLADGTTQILNNYQITKDHGAGGVRFLPDANENGTDFGFHVKTTMNVTGGGASAPKTVTFAVYEANDAPIATDDSLSMHPWNTERSIPVEDLIGNDFAGPDNESGQTITVIDVYDAVGGSVVLSDGVVRFAPDDGFAGEASFKYDVEDNGTTNGIDAARSASAKATFHIYKKPMAPVAADVAATEDTETAAISIEPNSEETDPVPNVTHFRISDIVGGTLSAGGVPIAEGAYLTKAEGLAGVKFKPNPDDNAETSGPFGFTIEASLNSDGAVGDKKEVRLNVTAVNDAPVAADDDLGSFTTDAETTEIAFAALLGNDGAGPNEGGQRLTVASVSDAVGGTAELKEGKIVFTFDGDPREDAGFTYAATDDGATNGAPDPKSDEARVAFDVVKSADASLAGLIVKSVAGGATAALSPSFAKDTLRYTVRVGNGVASIVLEPTASSRHAGTQVNGKAVAQGQASDALSLKVGKNEVSVRVTAQDGASVRTYKLEVWRADEDPTPTTETRSGTVVTNGGQAPIDIVRTTEPGGKTTDKVTLTDAQTGEIVESLAGQSGANARIVLDDPEDESVDPADEVAVTVPNAAVNRLSSASVGLSIETRGIVITIPQQTLSTFKNNGKDLTMLVSPVRDAETQAEIDDRVLGSPELNEAGGGEGTETIGDSSEIEANISGAPTQIVFPIDTALFPTEPAALRAFVNRLGVFVEHSDGEKKLMRGTVVYDADGRPIGIQITVEKFSTFTVVLLPPSKELPAAMTPFADGTFRPDAAILRGDFAAAVAATIAPEEAQGRSADEAIALVRERKLMIGDASGNFRAQDALTRAEAAAILVRAMEIALGTGAAPFRDVPAAHWAAPFVAAAREAGWMAGYGDGQFRPDRPLTRAEAATLLQRAFGRPAAPADAVVPWPDVAPEHWAYEAIRSVSNPAAAVPES